MLAKGQPEFGLQAQSFVNYYKHYKHWEEMPGLLRIFFPLLVLNRISVSFFSWWVQQSSKWGEKKKKEKTNYPARNQKSAPQAR